MSTLLRLTPLILLAGLVGPAAGQAGPESEVEFVTTDGVTVFGDLYRTDASESHGLILLFHQGGGDARGEYGPLIPRLLAQGFDALAIDQRRGGARFGGVNRTLEGVGDTEYSYCDALPDLEGALVYAQSVEPGVRPVLWGSSYSAALVFQLAARHPDRVSGVLAFSPASGEPMEGCEPEPWSRDLAVPVLVLRPASEVENEGTRQQLQFFAEQGHQTFVADPGVHGSSMLNAGRVEGDTEPTWHVVSAFLASVSN